LTAVALDETTRPATALAVRIGADRGLIECNENERKERLNADSVQLREGFPLVREGCDWMIKADGRTLMKN
jgi:hypothetical protein